MKIDESKIGVVIRPRLIDCDFSYLISLYYPRIEGKNRFKYDVDPDAHKLIIKALPSFCNLESFMLELNTMKSQLIKELSKMAKLTTKARKKIPSKKFAEPAERKYPIEDKAHAKNAKARATQQEKKGKLSPSKANMIKAKANKVLGKGKKK